MASTDALPVPIKNTAFRLYMEFRDNTGALITGGITAPDTELSKDGASFADATNEFTEIGTSGVGYVDLTSGEMNFDSVVVKATCTNSNALANVLYLYPQETGNIKVDVQSYGGSAGSFSGGKPAVLGSAIPDMDNTFRILSGVTDQYCYFRAISSTDHESTLTGLVAGDFNVWRSRNGGTATQYTTPTITEVSGSNMQGIYKLLLDEDMTLDAGDYSQEMVLRITGTGMKRVDKFIEIFRRDVDAPIYGVALSDIPVYMVSNSDHVTPATGKTLTVQVSKNGGAFAAAAGTVAEVGSGLYQFDATAADMTADVVVLKFTEATCDPFLTTIKTVQ